MVLATSIRVRTSEIVTALFATFRAMCHQQSVALRWFPTCCGLEYTSTNACQSENNRHTRPVGAYDDVFPNIIYKKSRVNTKHEGFL